MILIALVSPLDALGDAYLFSAHMLQHVLLLLAPVPLIAGLPEPMVPRILAAPASSRALRLLGYPATSWLLGVLTLWARHSPVLYDVALANENLHLAERLCFLVSGFIYWWPVLAPGKTARLSPMRSVFYVFGGMAANSPLGLVLTFGPVGMHPGYLQPADPLAAVALARRLGPDAGQRPDHGRPVHADLARRAGLCAGDVGGVWALARYFGC